MFFHSGLSVLSTVACDVYLARLRMTNYEENTQTKIKKLFEAAGFERCITSGDLTAVKLHMGERGNDGYIRPPFVRQVVEKIRSLGGLPFLTDTNTMYIYKRNNAVDHIETGLLNGFSYATVQAPIIIADGLKGDNSVSVSIHKNHFDSVTIAGDIVAAPCMIVLSHVKGHILAGFGGAIKNLAMGCATPLGKKDQHQGMKARVDTQKCIGCKTCVTACPFNCISMDEEGKAQVDKDACYGCAACLGICSNEALGFNWKDDQPVFIERMVEYAYGAVAGKENKIGYINFLMNITPHCDCEAFSDSPIVSDIGILASTDPVAIDQASIDLINNETGNTGTLLHSHHAPGEDKFTGVWENIDGRHQLIYGEKIGLGTRDYRLIEI